MVVQFLQLHVKETGVHKTVMALVEFFNTVVVVDRVTKFQTHNAALGQSLAE